MTAEPLPLAATDLFRAVMVAAAWRCQRTGQCGNGHIRTESRCPRTHGGRVLLMAAPADPSTPDRAAAALPADALRAWCPGCHTTARRMTTCPAPARQDGLFDL
ncbi:hypothetical protein OUQ49_05710 [Streptomyces cavourensis]|uniref:hypothetical protein n=1 Tax=Streptomyces cavourensis TaxID=67258 RepID=UPI0022775289|nr:hypothetical protein [Streptomyces cavourensis]WAE65266.1 hypothetical protein OUQ49_05710 [Streptomyces cavourensis]